MNQEQEDLFEYLKSNRGALEELLAKLSQEETTNCKKPVKDLQMQESIFLAGSAWSKIAEDSEGNAYMLANEKICSMEFGKTNDWRESSIRDMLNNELYQKIASELGENALITIQTDLFSHDGLKDYGTCEDKISLLTYDIYRNNRCNIKGLKEWWWLATPNSTASGCGYINVLRIKFNSEVDHEGCGYSGAVRPFIILKSDTLVLSQISSQNDK